MKPWRLTLLLIVLASRCMASSPVATTIQGAGTTNHVVNLSWNPSTSADVVGYNVYRGPNGTTWSKINPSLVGSTLYSDSTVADGTTYYYATTAVNSNGDESSKSAPVEVVIPSASKTATTTALASSLNSSDFGQSVTFTARVSPSTLGTPTGTVTFMNGETTLGTATLSGGNAAFTTSTLALGVHSLTAEYNGSADYNTSTSSALSETVNKAGTSVTLASSVKLSAFNQAVNFT